MSSIQAPSWALLAGAIDGVGDSHLPRGIHVRAVPTPRLGLPATPLVVTRSVLDLRMMEQLASGDGVTWIDSKGNTLTLPFTVTPDNPVFGYFPQPEVIWARLAVRPASTHTTPGIVPVGFRPEINLSHLNVPGVNLGNISHLGNGLGNVLGHLETNNGNANPNSDSPNATATSSKDGMLKFEAIQDSALGPVAIQTTTHEPYVLANWTIPRVRVSGSGLVTGIRWIDISRTKGHRDETFWELWSLPVEPAPRYTPTATAPIDGEKRVERAAVQKQPLYVAYNAATAASAPGATGVDALQRIGQVKGNLQHWLKVLLHDLSAPTWDLKDSKPIDKTTATSADGTMGLGIEKFLIVSSIDPDVGHYLGLGDVDLDVKATPGSLVLYKIRGLYRWNKAAWTFSERLSFLGGLRSDRVDAINQFPELKTFGIEPVENGPFVDLHQIAVAVYGQPPQGMSAPIISPPDDRGWLSSSAPPDVRRALRIIADGFQAPAVAAVAAHDQYGDRTLHAFPNGQRVEFKTNKIPPGTPLPWVVSQPQDPSQSGQGRFEDRDAPESNVDYRIAKGDWFGRWSDWGKKTAPAKARTIPTPPTILIYPAPPVFAPPPVDPPAGLLSGTIELRIPMPNQAELPAGGATLAQLDLFETFGGNPVVSASYVLSSLPITAKIIVDPSSDPAHPQTILVIKRTGPALLPSQSIKVSYKARWKDVLNHDSLDSFPAEKTIIDPRPPAAPVIIRPLDYTSRPDAMGHARVEFEFPGVDGVGYRVYASTETTLLKALETINPSLGNNILNTALINDRAGALVDHKELFSWDHFELITREPLYRDATSGKVKFVHRLSAGLNVAVFYRVVAEGPHGGLSELSKSSMFAFGVPNVGGPGQPLISIVNVPNKNPVQDGVVVRVKVPHGASKPYAWRLRRTSTPGADPLRMPIILEGLLKPTPQPHIQNIASTDEGDTFEIVASDPLKAWVNYRFVVEVQGESPPGSTPAQVVGEWGDASAPTKLAVIPKDPPVALQSVVVSAVAGGLHIVLTPAAGLTLESTMMGNFCFETWRLEKDQRPVKLDLVFIYNATSHSWSADHPVAVPAGGVTSVSARVIDPLGRIGPATLSNSI